MSSLSLLNNDSIGKVSESTIMCSPALAVLLIGAIVVMYDIVIKRPGLAGYHLILTIGATIIVLLLCLMGMTNVGFFIALFPIVIFVAIIVIILLALMIGSPYEPEPEPEPKPEPEPEPEPRRPSHKPGKNHLRSSYKYVMTGKGFSLFQ
jgi:hypothetical protein